MFDKIEKIILDKLSGTSKFKGFEIVPFPENFESFDFNSERGCLLVKYDGSEYGTPQTINFVRQDETLEFSVMAGFRYTRTLKEVYPYLKEIKKVLTGLNILGKKLYPKKRRYIGHIKGDLYYGYVFAVTLPSTEETPDDTPPEKSKISNGGDIMQPAQFAGSPPPNSQAAPADADIMQPCSSRSHVPTPAAPADAIPPNIKTFQNAKIDLIA